nr:CpsD/CapB family tyrosine-protein kinase [Ornithinimicrobium cryptoxanthini]
MLDTNVRGESDIHRVTDEPVIGAIAFDKDAEDHPLVIEIDPHSHRSEAFRSLRTNLFYLSPDEPARTLLITSTVPNEGKSTTSVNLALTMAETGARVCLIEGDLRRPRMLEYMGLESAAGLTDVLVGRVDVEDVLQPHVSNLHVLGCGPIPPNPSELLGSAAMERLLERLSKDYDYVVIDAPPVLAVTDAAVLSTLADGTIVVVGVGVVKRDTLSRAIAALERVDANVLGVVLNRLPVKGPDAYAYDYQSYRPGVEIEGRGRRARSKASRRRSELAQTQE